MQKTAVEREGKPMTTFKNILGVAILVAVSLISIALIVTAVRAGYQYDREIGSYWTLADKSSTIEAKSRLIDQFVLALEKQNLQGVHDALIFPNLDNSFDANFEALKTLQQRLREIQTMNPASFEYQTAIQQITAQEQGEAQQMLDVFWGSWKMKYHFLVWDYIGGVWMFVLFGLVVLGFHLAGSE